MQYVCNKPQRQLHEARQLESGAGSLVLLPVNAKMVLSGL